MSYSDDTIASWWGYPEPLRFSGYSTPLRKKILFDYCEIEVSEWVTQAQTRHLESLGWTNIEVRKWKDDRAGGYHTEYWGVKR